MTASEKTIKNSNQYCLPLLPNWILVLVVGKMVQQLEHNHSEDFGIIEWLLQSFLKKEPGEVPFIRFVFWLLHKPEVIFITCIFASRVLTPELWTMFGGKLSGRCQETKPRRELLSSTYCSSTSTHCKMPELSKYWSEIRTEEKLLHCKSYIKAMVVENITRRNVTELLVCASPLIL